MIDHTLLSDDEQAFESYLDALSMAMQHRSREQPLRDYCTGLLLPDGRKSVEPIAARIAPSGTRTMHKKLLNFVSDGAWSDEAVLAAMRRQVMPALDAHGAVRHWIVDETGMAKKGEHSVGVARQYCGELGKVESCQVMVSLSVANDVAALPIAARLYLPGLILGFRVLDLVSGDQGADQGAEESFSPFTRVMDELKEPKIDREFLLGDAAMRSQPGAQQRPASFHGVDVDLVEAIAVLVARIFATAVTDGLVPVAPHRQTSVNAVFVGIDHRAFDDDFRNDRLDRFLLHIGQHPENNLAITLDQAQDRRLFLLERTTAARSLQPSTPPGASFFWTAAGLPLCPATTYTSSASTSPSSVASGTLATRPSRRCDAMSWTSSSFRPNSLAICWFDRFRPMKYRHKTQTRSG